jgi:hypothetical protein
VLKPLQIFVGERLDRRSFSLADPCNLDFHEEDLTTEDTEEHRVISWF